MLVEIDDKSGFCYGVIRAIEKAESELSETKKIYSLGEIVHNSVEVKRLAAQGLQSINHNDLEFLKNEKVLIRAHGEPPATYEIAKNNSIAIVDCTCPVVIKLQERIKNKYEQVKSQGGQIVIFGKKNHAEVNGLVGQVNGDAIVIENIDDILQINFLLPVFLFSQTTMAIEKFDQISDIIKQKMLDVANGNEIIFEKHNTICGQVSSRKPHLEEFSRKHDVVVFVSGKQSSNGKALYNACKNVNKKSYMVEDENDLNFEWFTNVESVGVCGATSTPKWLMEKVADKIREIKTND